MIRKCRLNPPLRLFSRLARVKGSAATLLAVALGAAAVVALASCGSEARLLPGETARDITANLTSVKRLADEGDCVAAESAARQVSEQIEALGGVDAKLKRALQNGATRLNEVVARCEETTGEATAPATVPTRPETTTEKPSKEKKPKGAATPTTPETTTTPSLPPQAKGKAKGLGNEEGGSEEEGPSSGGVGPGAPAGGGN